MTGYDVPRCLRRVLFWIVLVQLAASLLLLGGFARLLALVLGSERAAKIGRSLISFIFSNCWTMAERFGLIRIDADCLDALRSEPRGLILAANHPTMFDAMLVVAHVPQSVCLMRRNLARNVLLGPGARLAGYISSDQPRVLVRDSVATLRAGHSLVMFPEGTRSSAVLPHSFRPGVALIARLADADIQTVLIRTDSPYLTKGWPVWRLPPATISITVSLGERFRPADVRGSSATALENYFIEAPTSTLTLAWRADGRYTTSYSNPAAFHHVASSGGGRIECHLRKAIVPGPFSRSLTKTSSRCHQIPQAIACRL